MLINGLLIPTSKLTKPNYIGSRSVCMKVWALSNSHCVAGVAPLAKPFSKIISAKLSNCSEKLMISALWTFLHNDRRTCIVSPSWGFIWRPRAPRRSSAALSFIHSIYCVKRGFLAPSFIALPLVSAPLLTLPAVPLAWNNVAALHCYPSTPVIFFPIFFPLIIIFF